MVRMNCSSGWASGVRNNRKTAIGGVVATFDQTALLHFVQQAHQRDRLDFKQVGQTLLVNAFMRGQFGQNLPLRARETGCAGPLFEAFTHQTGNVMEDKAEDGLGHRQRT